MHDSCILFFLPSSHPVRLLSLLTHLWVLAFDFRKVTFLLSQVTGWYHSTNDEFVQLGGLCNIILSPLKAISEKKSHSIEIIQSYSEHYGIQCNLIWTFFFTFALESWISPCTTFMAFAYNNSLFQHIWMPVIIAEVLVWLSASWLYSLHLFSFGRYNILKTIIASPGLWPITHAFVSATPWSGSE